MDILGIIPARGGSKSIPYKNIYPVAGKPLISYVVKAAKDSKLITRLIVSTDDEKIAAVAKKYGAETPFMRPAELAGDHTLDLPVFQHALNWFLKNENYKPDLIVQLRPTSPLLTGEDIDTAIKLLLKNPGADSVRSVSPPPQTPFKMWTVNKNNRLSPLLTKAFPAVFKKFKAPYDMPRQLLPQTWQYNAYVEVLRYNTIMKLNSMTGKKVIPFLCDEKKTVDIDSIDHLRYAEFVIKNQKNDRKNK